MKPGPISDTVFLITQQYWDGGVNDPENPWRDAAGRPYNPYPWNGHTGRDSATPRGTPLLSPIEGVVKQFMDFPSGFTGKSGYGVNVEISGTGKWEPYYAILAHGMMENENKGAFLTPDLARVSAGTPLMLANSTGWSTGDHAHEAYRYKDKARWTWPMGGWLDPDVEFVEAGGVMVPIDRVLEMESLLQRRFDVFHEYDRQNHQLEVELAAIREAAGHSE